MEDKNTPTKMLSKAFWCGFAVHLCISGVIQDWYGKEGYIQKVQNDWMDTHWFMWAVFAAIAGWIYSRVQARVGG